jgi:hypothetical protein
LRRWRHRILLVPALVGGWCWFGLSGALPLALWWWHDRSRAATPEAWVIDPAQVRSARLGRWRTCVRPRSGPMHEIFHDEISPSDLACLRRTLKLQLSAGHRSQHIQPV